jgi:peptidoglycan hydrolase-like protein with peptidoglycan-binding domain
MACLLRAALVASVVALAASFEPAQADAQSAGNVGTAALQVALRAQGLYPGTVDGIAGPATAAGVRTVERRAGLAVDGIAGPRVRRARRCRATSASPGFRRTVSPDRPRCGR